MLFCVYGFILESLFIYIYRYISVHVTASAYILVFMHCVWVCRMYSLNYEGSLETIRNIKD